MILPDVNLLIYAYDDESRFHKLAKEWLRQRMENDQVFLSWHTVTGFLRIITNSAIFANAFSLNEAIVIVDDWLARDNVHLIALEKKNWPLFSSVLIEGQATGNLVMDAHLAAMALSSGATVATTDRDFLRFSGLQTLDPIKTQDKKRRLD